MVIAAEVYFNSHRAKLKDSVGDASIDHESYRASRVDQHFNASLPQVAHTSALDGSSAGHRYLNSQLILSDALEAAAGPRISTLSHLGPMNPWSRQTADGRHTCNSCLDPQLSACPGLLAIASSTLGGQARPGRPGLKSCFTNLGRPIFICGNEGAVA